MLVWIILVGLLVVTALIIMPLCYPELFVRAGKFLFRPVRHLVGKPAKPKARKLTPNEVLANQIEQQLTMGQTLRYKIPETSGGGFITVELNPQYPQKGRKYILSMENMVNGMPGGKKTILYDSDNSIDLATSVLDRNGELFVAAEEIPVSAGKVAVDAKREAESAGKVGNVV